MSASEKAKPFPVFRTDEEAEAFVESADLSQYDFSRFKPMHFEFGRVPALADMEIPQPLLDALVDKAARRGMPVTTYIRELLEQDVAGPQ